MLGLGKEEGAEGGSCSHGQRNIGGKILPVNFPDCVNGRHSTTIGMYASQTSGIYDDGEDCEAERQS